MGFNYIFFLIRWSRYKHEGSMLYGLQRSGTNIVNIALGDYGVCVLNKYELPVYSVFNRHHRFRSQLVPTRSLAEYFLKSELQTGPINIKARCIVVIREPESWLNSIIRWGIANSWFKENEINHTLISAFSQDYLLYLDFWRRQRDEYPQKVKIIKFTNEYWDLELNDMFQLTIQKSTYADIKVRGSLKPNSSDNRIDVVSPLAKEMSDAFNQF